jgi:hypothetical protein
MDSKRKMPDEEGFVKNLVPDPSQPPDVTLLSGYSGRSSRPGHWRLYLSVELTSYVDIPEADIVHSQPLDKDQSPLGGTLLWVRRGADLKTTSMASRESQADFLRGTIAGSITAGGLGFGLEATALPTTFSVTQCATCPTSNGGNTCVPATCTLATSCYTQVITDRGCGKKAGGGVFGLF